MAPGGLVCMATGSLRSHTTTLPSSCTERLGVRPPHTGVSNRLTLPEKTSVILWLLKHPHTGVDSHSNRLGGRGRREGVRKKRVISLPPTCSHTPIPTPMQPTYYCGWDNSLVLHTHTTPPLCGTESRHTCMEI